MNSRCVGYGLMEYGWRIVLFYCTVLVDTPCVSNFWPKQLSFFSSQALAIINYSVFTSDFMTTVLNVSSLCALTEIKSWLRHWRLVLTRELVKDRLTVRLKAQLTKWPVTIAWKLQQRKSSIDTHHWIYCIYIFWKIPEFSPDPEQFRNFGNDKTSENSGIAITN